MIPNKAPPDSALRELRVGEFTPVAFNKLWMFSISFLLNLSFCVTTAFEQNYLKCMWGVLILLLSYVLLDLTNDTLEKIPIYGNVILSGWYIYGLLQWVDIKYQVIIGLMNLLLSVTYFTVEHFLFKPELKKTIFYFQLGTLLIPVATSSSLDPGDLILKCVLFLICWWSYWFVSWVIFGPPFDQEKSFMAIIPLLRLPGYLTAFYAGIFEVALFFLFYIQGPSVTPVSDFKSSPEGEEKPFLQQDEDLTIDVDEEEFIKQEAPQEPSPPPEPPKKQSRFKVLPPLSSKPAILQVTYKPAIQQPIVQKIPSATYLQETIIEKLGGNKLKNLYGGGGG